MPNLTVPSWSFLKNKSEVGESWGAGTYSRPVPLRLTYPSVPFFFGLKWPRVRSCPTHHEEGTNFRGVCATDLARIDKRVEEPSTTPVEIGEGSESNSKLLYIEVHKKCRENQPKRHATCTWGICNICQLVMLFLHSVLMILNLYSTGDFPTQQVVHSCRVPAA